MRIYTFHLCNADSASVSSKALSLQSDADAFAKAGALLDEHPSSDYVEVYDGNRQVVARNRFRPIIREFQ